MSLILPAAASGMRCRAFRRRISISRPARNPDQVQGLFRRTIPVGVQFGVVRVLVAEMEFEVATFRSDGIYLDGRHPSDIRVFDA